MTRSCCTPSTTEGTPDPHLAAVDKIEPAVNATQSELKARMARIPSGFFDMGARKSSFPQDNDSPRQRMKIGDFLLSPHAVTNAEYARFVAATGYRTVAEREGWSFVFHLFLDAPDQFSSPPGLLWWRQVEGSFWAGPEGPESTIAGREDHPAVHLSWYDALAYCRWSGLRLPTEAEWEYAARGRLKNKKFPWGNTLTPGGRHAMNTWQGDFPQTNSGEDGFVGTAPVDAFAPNEFGMYNMTGNVWEWCANLFERSDADFQVSMQRRVQRGGSYLCHISYCDRYHVHSRIGTEPDSSAGHSGFRVAMDI